MVWTQGSSLEGSMLTTVLKGPQKIFVAKISLKSPNNRKLQNYGVCLPKTAIIAWSDLFKNRESIERLSSSEFFHHFRHLLDFGCRWASLYEFGRLKWIFLCDVEPLITRNQTIFHVTSSNQNMEQIAKQKKPKIIPISYLEKRTQHWDLRTQTSVIINRFKK